MIGVIVTGHGTFATGIKEAVRLLAGRPESFEAVDYLQEDSTDDYEAKLRAALSALRGCTGVLILADMLEAAPYKVCADVRRKVIDSRRIEIVAGVNLGMLMQVNLARGYVSNVRDLADLAVEEGRHHIIRYADDNEN